MRNRIILTIAAGMCLTSLELKAQEKTNTEDSQIITTYGSFRPSVTYRNDKAANVESMDVTDFFSRLGVKAERKIGNNLTVFAQGEWDIDIEGDSDFGDARLGYAGLKGKWGQVAIGKQWSPHYNIIAEVSDVFNHRNSPFGYNEISPFRTNNLVTYSGTFGKFKIDTGVQINGSPESTNGGAQGYAYGRDFVDTSSFGVAYAGERFYLGSSYLSDKNASGVKRNIFGFAGSVNVTKNLYAAVNYQNLKVNNAGVDLNGSTLDVAAVYSFNKGFKLKTSYFTYDNTSVDGTGYNVTIEKNFKDYARTFIEVLNYKNSNTPAVNSISVGVRYDFSHDFKVK